MKINCLIFTLIINCLFAHGAQAPNEQLLSPIFAAAKAGNWDEYNNCKQFSGTLSIFMATSVIKAAANYGFHDIDIILEKETDALTKSDLNSAMMLLQQYRKKSRLDKISGYSSKEHIAAWSITGYGWSSLGLFKEQKFSQQKQKRHRKGNKESDES